MRLEGVVHVLRKVHKTLRSHGLLLDIHPLPRHPWVEVWKGGRRKRLGLLDSTVGIETIRAVRALPTSIEREGLFTARAHRWFDWRSHYSGVDDWFRRREEYHSTNVIPPARLRRIRSEM